MVVAFILGLRNIIGAYNDLVLGYTSSLPGVSYTLNDFNAVYEGSLGNRFGEFGLLVKADSQNKNFYSNDQCTYANALVAETSSALSLNI